MGSIGRAGSIQSRQLQCQEVAQDLTYYRQLDGPLKRTHSQAQYMDKTKKEERHDAQKAASEELARRSLLCAL